MEFIIGGINKQNIMKLISFVTLNGSNEFHLTTLAHNIPKNEVKLKIHDIKHYIHICAYVRKYENIFGLSKIVRE